MKLFITNKNIIDGYPEYNLFINNGKMMTFQKVYEANGNLCIILEHTGHLASQQEFLDIFKDNEQYILSLIAECESRQDPTEPQKMED